jgi:hypothetical protein
MDCDSFTVGELVAAVGREMSGKIVELMVRNRMDGRYKARPQTFHVPSGKHKGKRPSQLTSIELQQAWAGYNGCGNTAVADELLKEIRRRERAKK